MSSATRTAVMVFTRDLRVRDNPALAGAGREADEVVPLFVIDESIVHAAGSNRIGFLSDSLHDLDGSLRKCGGRLVLRGGRWIDEVLAVAHGASASAIHIADDVSWLAQRRADDLRRVAEGVGVQVHTHPGITVVPPGQLRPARREGYEVFTPYYRRWAAEPWRHEEPAPRTLVLPRTLDSPSPDYPGVEVLDRLLGAAARSSRSLDVIVGGETEGRRRLDAFIAEGLEQYGEQRDVLALDATSRLSAFLHFGCLSPLELATRSRSQLGGEAFVRQLCWRDFFHQLLAVRPDAAHGDYRPSHRVWNEDPDAFEAWQAGRTGFPLVDAAMRQLATEGFMHNRARMVVASFLCKDLYLDWRLGAAHFMSLLVDGDIANNQLNWQWVAGTGSDTNPNRVFSPVVQGRRYDPRGEYIRRHVPELAGLAPADVHWPDPATRREVGYALPLVDHQEAIASYRARSR